MRKALDRLKELLERDCDSKEVRWFDASTCSGMIYGYASAGVYDDNIDPVTTVKEAMGDVCDGGLQCDQCKVYNVLQLFVSEVVVVEVPKDSLNLMGMSEAQLTVVSNALKVFIQASWATMLDLGEDIEEEEKVGMQKELRVAEEMYEVVTEYFR